jgi:hypothetical protein
MKKALDPVRLADDARTSAPLAEALRSVRANPDPRALERMSTALGVIAPLAPPPVPPASGLAAASGLSLPTLGVLALVGAVGAGAAFGAATAPERSAPPSVHATGPGSAARTPAQIAAVVPEATVVAEVARTPAPAATLRRRRSEPEPGAPETPRTTQAEPVAAPAPAASDAASRLREEALLVRNAERLLGSEPGRALALTEERRRRFPGGALDQEAEVVAIDALLRLGRRDAAGARARAFEARHPGSLHARRVRALFGSNP